MKLTWTGWIPESDIEILATATEDELWEIPPFGGHPIEASCVLRDKPEAELLDRNRIAVKAIMTLEFHVK